MSLIVKVVVSIKNAERTSADMKNKAMMITEMKIKRKGIGEDIGEDTTVMTQEKIDNTEKIVTEVIVMNEISMMIVTENKGEDPDEENLKRMKTITSLKEDIEMIGKRIGTNERKKRRSMKKRKNRSKRSLKSQSQ